MANCYRDKSRECDSTCAAFEPKLKEASAVNACPFIAQALQIAVITSPNGMKSLTKQIAGGTLLGLIRGGK